jgi:glyoxalase family protein
MKTSSYINGLHHVTALASSAKANLAFYTNVLGLKLIKKTINFDSPDVYHLYYGDAEGNPGTVLTFFPYEGLVRGRAGAGQVTKLRYSVAPEALTFWKERFHTFELATQEDQDGFGNALVGITDPDGMVIEIVADADDTRPAIAAEGIPAAFGLKGFHSALMIAKSAKVTNPYVEVLTCYSIKETRGNLSRWHAGVGGPGSYLDIVEMPDAKMGLQGAGSVHHIAFRTPDDATEARETASESS